MSDETTSLAQILLKTVSVNVCFDESLCTNQLLPRGSTPGEPRGSGSFGISFFPAGDGVV